MTDIILSSLLNLFALFGKKGEVDTVESRKVLVSYMRRHFGIRNTDFWLGMYDDLRELYNLSPELNYNDIVDGLCKSLHGKIASAEETMMVLRLMEFCAVDGLNETELFMLKDVAKRMHVPTGLYEEFHNFVYGRESKAVCRHQLTSGELKTLWISSMNLMVFSWQGKEELALNDVPVVPGAFQVLNTSGVLKTHSGETIYYSTIMEAHDVAQGKKRRQRSRVDFCARDINFRFPNSDNGMHNFSFNLHSGELLAIMGGSGTGKSTLLSLLNGNYTPQSGSITINGHSITEPEVKSLIGYVPQDDLLIEELTVRDNLLFTARLCFEGVAMDEIKKKVDTVLADLDLTPTANLKVGSPLEKTISGGQRKRLNIALELIREPSVLFLDEPTSGLSSADTEKVINLLKEQTFRGKLIVVNIHQPSSDVYKLFDRLWILDRGGYPVFDGNPIDAISYFKQAANYIDAETSACPTCGNVNPEIILNIIDEKALDEIGQVSNNRKTTPQEWHRLYLDNRPEMEKPKVYVVPQSDQKRPNVLKQFWIFLQRNFRTKITNIQYLCITALEAPLLAIVCAMLTRYAPETGYTLMDNKNFVSYMFMAIIVATFTGMSGSAEEIIRDRALLKREKFLRLSYRSYIASKIIYSAGISLLQTLFFVAIGNAVMGIHNMFMLWWGVLFTVSFLSNLVGLLLSQCLNSIVAIYITIPMLLIPQILLCGVVVDFSDLTPHSKTGNVPFIGNCIPSRWAYEALAVTSFSDNDFERDYFAYDKEKYETQFYDKGYLEELESEIETMRDEQRRGKEVKPGHIAVVKNSLPFISAFAGMKPYDGDYSYNSLHEYLQEISRNISNRGNKATLDADRIMSQKIAATGREEQQNLKKASINTQLSDIAMGANLLENTGKDETQSEKLVSVVDNHLVPRSGFIFLTPLTHCGNAPFYSSEKLMGNYKIPTLWFNLAVLYIMCLFLAILLFTDVPGRYVRKEES